MNRQKLGERLIRIFDTTNDQNQLGPILIAVVITVFVAVCVISVTRGI